MLASLSFALALAAAVSAGAAIPAAVLSALGGVSTRALSAPFVLDLHAPAASAPSHAAPIMVRRASRARLIGIGPPPGPSILCGVQSRGCDSGHGRSLPGTVAATPDPASLRGRSADTVAGRTEMR